MIFLKLISAIMATALVLANGAYLLPMHPVAAAEGVTFTVTAPGAWLRVGPDFAAPNTAAVFKDEVYDVLERTADSEWLRLGGGQTRRNEGWLHVSLGATKAGNIAAVAITPSAFVGAPPATVPTLPSYIPRPLALSAKARQLLQNSGRDPNKFTVIGDCNAEPKAYLGRITAGLYQVPSDASYVLPSISRFGKSFPHWSMAAKGGFRAASLLDVSWADPSECKAGENALTCELRRSNAGLAFVELGTGDQFLWKEFEANYREIIETTLRYGALPVAVTKADNLEAQAGAPPHAINNSIRKLAAEYGVPLLDFWQVAQGLPNAGLIDEGNADFHLSPAGSDLHLLVTLQTLAALGNGRAVGASAATPASPNLLQAATVPVAAAATATFVVDVAAANIRNAPALTAAIMGRGLQGQAFAFVGWNSDKTWAQVTLPTGGTGWIFAVLGSLKTPSATPQNPVPPIQNLPNPADPVPPKTVSIIPAPVNPNPSITINASAVNVRSRPSTQASIHAVARAGQQFPVLSRTADGAWVEIAYPNAGPSWVFASLGTLNR